LRKWMIFGMPQKMRNADEGFRLAFAAPYQSY